MENLAKYLVRGRFEGNFKTDQQKVLPSGEPFPKGDEHRVKIFRGIISNTEEINEDSYEQTSGLYNFQDLNNIQINTSDKWQIKNNRIFSLHKMKLSNVEVSNVQILNGKTVGVIRGDVVASVAEGNFEENPDNPSNLSNEIKKPIPISNENRNKKEEGDPSHNGETGEEGNSLSGNDPIGNNNRTPLWRRSGCNFKWLRWLLFITSILVLLYLLSRCTQIGQMLVCKYDEGRYRAEWEKFKEKNDSLETKIDSLEIEDDGGHFVDADFLIVTYYFDSDAGTDLDTRTRLINPVSSNILGFGFCQNNKFESSGFLSWAGDNQGYGAESCLIDLRKFSNEDIIQVECSALWFTDRLSGEIRLDIRAFKGGVVNQIGREFVNSGGIQKGFFGYPDNIIEIHNNEGSKYLGQYIGTITYNKEINYLSLDKY